MKLIKFGNKQKIQQKFNVGDKIVHTEFFDDGRGQSESIIRRLIVTKVMRTRMHAEEVKTGNIYEMYMSDRINKVKSFRTERV